MLGLVVYMSNNCSKKKFYPLDMFEYQFDFYMDSVDSIIHSFLKEFKIRPSEYQFVRFYTAEF